MKGTSTHSHTSKGGGGEDNGHKTKPHQTEQRTGTKVPGTTATEQDHSRTEETLDVMSRQDEVVRLDQKGT